jgi:RNA polymerase sigma factor (sigma-70 family)
MARPLSKRKQDGTLYKRPEEIEAAIDNAIQADIDSVVQRGLISIRSAPAFLPLECLVHLIRDAGRSGDERVMNALMPVLLTRCETILKAKIRPDSVPDVESIREEILGELTVLFAKDILPNTTNELDYFECRFNEAFLTFRLPFIKRERARTHPLVFAPQDTEPDEESTSEDFFVQISDAFRCPEDQINYVLRNRLVNAIAELPLDERRAAVLYFYYGYPKESKDPSVTTIASLCGVTPRTVHNRLTRAIAMLSKILTGDEEHINEHESVSKVAQRRVV